MVEMRWAQPGEKNEILDLCDFVFSKYHRPHDFESLMPKLYAGKNNASHHHFVIREDGRIVATLLAYPIEMNIGSNSFTVIGVGNVCVHPRAQGRGYMKHLLAAVDSHAGEHEAVFAFLGGQRQRYGYFGFQPAGYHMDCSVSRANVRHALSGCDDSAVQIVPMEQAHVPAAIALHTAQTMYCTRSEDNFLNIVRTWYLNPYAILINGEMTGFAILKAGGDTATVDELRLKSERTLPSVIKKLSGVFGNLKFNVTPCDTERAGYLTTLAENWQITRDHMFKFYHEERLRDMMRDAGLPSSVPLYFDGFTLPLPLFMSSPDSV